MNRRALFVAWLTLAAAAWACTSIDTVAPSTAPGFGGGAPRPPATSGLIPDGAPTDEPPCIAATCDGLCVTRPDPADVGASSVCCPSDQSVCVDRCCGPGLICLFDACRSPGLICQTDTDCGDGRHCDPTLRRCFDDVPTCTQPDSGDACIPADCDGADLTMAFEADPTRLVIVVSNRGPRTIPAGVALRLSHPVDAGASPFPYLFSTERALVMGQSDVYPVPEDGSCTTWLVERLPDAGSDYPDCHPESDRAELKRDCVNF